MDRNIAFHAFIYGLYIGTVLGIVLAGSLR